MHPTNVVNTWMLLLLFVFLAPGALDVWPSGNPGADSQLGDRE
jgi:hypothetical protein